MPLLRLHAVAAEQTLENIIICRVFSHEEQMSAVKPIAALLSDLEQGPFRILIVDSIIALFRVEFAGRGAINSTDAIPCDVTQIIQLHLT